MRINPLILRFVYNSISGMAAGGVLIWVFEVLNGEISIQDSAFMQFGELSPRAAKQVVVSGTAIDYQGNIEWKLTKH